MSKLIQIVSASELSGQQTEFNQLIQQIDKLKKECSKLNERLEKGQTIFRNQLLPFEIEWFNLNRSYAEELALWLGKVELSAAENKKVAWLLRSVISQIDFYFVNDSKLQLINSKANAIITPINTNETADYEAFANDHRASRKKKQSPIEKQTPNTFDITKMMKKLYTTLAKNLHPDLEQDEHQRHIKTELMKQVTTSYSDKDIYSLLQLHSQHITNNQQDTINHLSNNQLSSYNDLLNKQLKTLSSEIKAIKDSPSNSFMLYLASGSEAFQFEVLNSYQSELAKRNHSFQEDIAGMGDTIKEFRKYLKSKEVDNEFYDNLE